MPELYALLADWLRQFPLLAVTILVSWYYMRLLMRQHQRELDAKEREISRILIEKNAEMERLIEERRKYFQLFLKEIEPHFKKPKGE
ncbi:MAG: hypothetical protein JWO38_661 [Gemmataceae bacterium]|nr:hypothetical protein [Gemmataceae bacterium]